mgnify:CR=1 FL=1
MNNFREVNDDLLRDWLSFREEMVLGTLTKEDRKHYIYFDEIAENILKNVPKQNQKYVKSQLDRLDKNFMDYICYWNEKYYRNGFCDGVELISGCFRRRWQCPLLLSIILLMYQYNNHNRLSYIYFLKMILNNFL